MLKEIGDKFNALTLTPRDVALCMFDERELTTGRGVTVFDEIENAVANCLRFLSF